MSTFDLKFKQEIHSFCLKFIKDKIQQKKELMDELQKSANLETKSSAGDKYETSRADLQNEVEKVAIQLSELLKQIAIIEQIDLKQEYSTVQTGALLVTDKGNCFFSIALGEVNLNKSSCIVLSLLSPLGQAFKQKEVGDSVQFRQQTHLIKSVI